MTLQIEITPDLQAFLDTTEGVWNTHGQALVRTGFTYGSLVDRDKTMILTFVINDEKKDFSVDYQGKVDFGRHYWLSRTGNLSVTFSEFFEDQNKGYMQFNYHLRMLHAFGTDKVYDALLRDMRFGEEAIELLQARGRSKEEVLRLVDYVYGRDIGEVEQEMGGVLSTLMAMASQNGTDLEKATKTEMARFTRKNQKICEKSSNKPDLTDKAQARIIELSVAVFDCIKRLPKHYQEEAPEIFEPGLDIRDVLERAHKAWHNPKLSVVMNKAIRLLDLVQSMRAVAAMDVTSLTTEFFSQLKRMSTTASMFVDAVYAEDWEAVSVILFPPPAIHTFPHVDINVKDD